MFSTVQKTRRRYELFQLQNLLVKLLFYEMWYELRNVCFINAVCFLDLLWWSPELYLNSLSSLLTKNVYFLYVMVFLLICRFTFHLCMHMFVHSLLFFTVCHPKWLSFLLSNCRYIVCLVFPLSLCVYLLSRQFLHTSNTFKCIATGFLSSYLNISFFCFISHSSSFSSIVTSFVRVWSYFSFIYSII